MYEYSAVEKLNECGDPRFDGRAGGRRLRSRAVWRRQFQRPTQRPFSLAVSITGDRSHVKCSTQTLSPKKKKKEEGRRIELNRNWHQHQRMNAAT